jgi:hypothetical protein
MKSILFQIFFILSVIFGLSACKKEAVSAADAPVENSLVKHAKAWIEKQKPAAQTADTEKMILLQQYLDFGKSSTESLIEGEQLLLVPVQDDYKAAAQIHQQTNVHLLLIFNSKGVIRKGHLVVFESASGQRQEVPSAEYAAIFNTGKVAVNGKFNFRSLTGRRLYELKYDDGQLKQAGYFKSGNPTGRVNASGCTDWYLVTTYYYTDGTTYTSESYVGRTCDYGPGEWQNLPPDQNGGGGPDQIIYEYAVTKPVEWTVETNPSGWWKVVSTEELTGKVDTQNPYGKKFLNAVHKYDDILNYGSWTFVWTKWNSTTVINSDAVASATVSGKVTPPPGVGNDHHVSPKTEYWRISQIVP